jgi:hypothetical protein
VTRMSPAPTALSRPKRLLALPFVPMHRAQSYLNAKPNATMVSVTVRGKTAGLRRLQIPLGNWFAPPDGNRSRLFLSNEKPVF